MYGPRLLVIGSLMTTCFIKVHELYGKSIISHFINGRFKLYWTGMNIIIGRMTEAEDFEYRIQF